MPTTSVPKMIGTMMHLMSLRKTLEITFKCWDWAGNSAPTRMPTTIEMMIQWVRLSRRNRAIMAYLDPGRIERWGAGCNRFALWINGINGLNALNPRHRVAMM